MVCVYVFESTWHAASRRSVVPACVFVCFPPLILMGNEGAEPRVRRPTTKLASRGLPKFAPCTCSKGPKYSAKFLKIKEHSRELDGPHKLFVSWVSTTAASTWHTECIQSVCGVGCGIGQL